MKNKETNMKNKEQFKVTLQNNMKRQVFIYNPNKTKEIKDKKGNVTNIVSNNGVGEYYNIKLKDGEIKVFDTVKQAFMVDKLLYKNIIVPLKTWEVEQENKLYESSLKMKEVDLNDATDKNNNTQ